PGVGLVARHRRRAPVAIAITDEGVVPAPAAGRDILAAGEIARQLRRRAGVAPRVAPAAAGTQRILELGLGGQPVITAGLLGQPRCVVLGIAHADVHHRAVRVRGCNDVILALVIAAVAYQIATDYGRYRV